MGETTGIAWTDKTHNEWMGCTEKSEACAPCYARTLVTRRMGYGWGEDAIRVLTTEANRRKPFAWDAEARRTGQTAFVFAFSLADVFDNWKDRRTGAQIAADQAQAEAEARAYRTPAGKPWSEAAIQRRVALYARIDLQLWRLRFLCETVAPTSALTWQLLTKRAEHVAELAPPVWVEGGWPQHAWLGVTTETAAWAALRLVWMLDLKRRAHVPLIFCSVEPLYSAIDFERLPRLDRATVERMLLAGRVSPTSAAEREAQLSGDPARQAWYREQRAAALTAARREAAQYAERYETLYRQHIGSAPTWNAFEAGAVGWVITGGQSAGSPRRWLVTPDGRPKPEALAWLRQIRNACARWQVPLFHKQWGGPMSKSFGNELDGRKHADIPGRPISSGQCRNERP